MEEEIMQLGGNIELSGFKHIDGGKMIVLKKIIGNYTNKISEKAENFEKLSLNMKKVHETEQNQIFEVHAKVLANGKAITASSSERNVFVAVDDVLRIIEKQITK